MPRKPKSDVATETETTSPGTQEGQQVSEAAGGDTESVHSYFRRYYEQNPRQLNIRSNKKAFRAWLDDHPEYDEIPPRVRNAVSNVKNLMRQKRKKQKSKTTSAPVAAQAGNGTARPASALSPRVLQTLEEQIDQCLAMAKSVDPEGLGEVIQSLRKARNEVVVKQGTP
jgi:hypothetical protein